MADKRAPTRRASRGRAGRLSAAQIRADRALLVEQNVHPILKMIEIAEKLEGYEALRGWDRIAKYFFAPLKAVEMQVAAEGKVTVKIGGEDDLRQREQWIREGRQLTLAEIEKRGRSVPGDLLDDVSDDVLN